MNALFQSAGAIIMKNSFIKIGDSSLLMNKKAHMILTYHDDWLAEIREPDLDEHLNDIKNCGKWVTKKFNLEVPIEFDTKIGNNYAECH